MKLSHIELVFHYKDGSREVLIQAEIGEDGWNQWGASKEQLGKNVQLLEDMSNAFQDQK